MTNQFPEALVSLTIPPKQEFYFMIDIYIYITHYFVPLKTVNTRLTSTQTFDFALNISYKHIDLKIK